jgi:hypothetical protein
MADTKKYQVLHRAIYVQRSDGKMGAEEYLFGSEVELGEAQAKHYLDIGAIGEPGSAVQGSASDEQDAKVAELEQPLADAQKQLADAQKTPPTPPAKK